MKLPTLGHPVQQLVGHLTGHGLYPLYDRHGHHVGWSCSCHGWGTALVNHNDANERYVTEHLTLIRTASR